MKKTIAIIGMAALLAACAPEPNTPMEAVVTERFTVKQIGVFTDRLAYNNRRGIYLLTDQYTGKEYVGVSGIGVSELGSHSVGKTHQQDER